jgi:hypothetical protein
MPQTGSIAIGAVDREWKAWCKTSPLDTDTR